MFDLFKRLFNINNKHSMYTFNITYRNLDREIEEIDFCAHTKGEAKYLFKYYCLQDLQLKKVLPMISIDVVYNEEDHLAYGDSYGTPDKYVEYLI